MLKLLPLPSVIKTVYSSEQGYLQRISELFLPHTGDEIKSFFLLVTRPANNKTEMKLLYNFLCPLSFDLLEIVNNLSLIIFNLKLQFRYPLWVSLTKSEKQSGPDILCFLCLFKILRFTDKRYLLYHKILILYKHNFVKLYGNSKSLKCFFMGDKSEKGKKDEWKVEPALRV